MELLWYSILHFFGNLKSYITLMVIQGSVAFVWNTLILWWRTFAMRFLWFLGWEGQALLSLAVWCGLGEGFGEDLSFPWVHDQYDSYDTVWPTHTSRRPSKLQAWRNSLVSSVEWRSESHALMILSNVTCTEFSRILTDSHGFMAEVVTYSFTVAARETDFSILKATEGF